LLTCLFNLVLTEVRRTFICFLGTATCFISRVVLQLVAHVNAARNWVNCLLVHFFNVVDVRAKWDFVGWGDLTCEGKQTQVADLLHCSRDFAVDVGLQARLVPVVQFAGGVHELGDER